MADKSDIVSVKVGKLRQIIRHVLNCDRNNYEERFIQAMLGPEQIKQMSADELEEAEVDFDKIQKLVDVFEASVASLNESLADPRTYFNDPITGH